jgi:hypothetical protein
VKERRNHSSSESLGDWDGCVDESETIRALCASGERGKSGRMKEWNWRENGKEEGSKRRRGKEG